MLYIFTHTKNVYIAFGPEQQHESLEECAEVVVVIDSGVLIQVDVAKHLQHRHSEMFQKFHIFQILFKTF